MTRRAGKLTPESIARTSAFANKKDQFEND